MDVGSGSSGGRSCDLAFFSISISETSIAGETAETVREATGFSYRETPTVPFTPDPTEAELALLRGVVCDEMLETYPDFCRRVWGRMAEASPDRKTA